MGGWARIKEGEKRICKECRRQSDGICFDLADAWQALGNICPRGGEWKVEAVRFFDKMMNEGQVKVEEGDGLIEFPPKVGLPSKSRCHHGWKMMPSCFARKARLWAQEIEDHERHHDISKAV